MVSSTTFCPPVRRTPSTLAHIRFLQGMSQAALAEKAGVGRSTIARLEAGRGRPQLSTATAIARALELSVGVVFPSLEEPEPDIEQRRVDVLTMVAAQLGNGRPDG